jgi:cellulose synthase/poly-beta-1,6-N-acetylglucosamine synthase-like glycosyltransferase
MSFCHAAMPSATTHALAEVDMADRFDLSVVAPCYNEALGLAEFHRRISATCRKTVGTDYEIILVNDGSQDGRGR